MYVASTISDEGEPKSLNEATDTVNQKYATVWRSTRTSHHTVEVKMGITYDDLVRVNKTIKTINFKGKDYAEVNQRIKAFRMLFPMGTIETEIASLAEGMCVIRAMAYDEGRHLLATGTAYEKEGTSNINRTSYIENCETSAVGRCLGMLGLGIESAIASAEEVTNADMQQEVEAARTKKIDEAKIVALKNKLDEAGIPVEMILEMYKIDSLADMQVYKWKHALDNMDKLKQRVEEGKKVTEA